MMEFISGEFSYLPVLAAVFLGVLALFLGVRYLLASRTNVVKDRLQRTVGTGTDVPDELNVGLKDAPSDGKSFFKQAIFSFSRLNRPSNEEELGRLRQRLSQAGLRGEFALVTYLSVKMVLCLFNGALFLWFNSIRPQPLHYAAFFAVALMIIGFYIPNLWLRGRVKGRQRAVNHALPDALDLIVTCVEAGLGLDAALNRVAAEMRLSAPRLSYELSQASLEMRSGLTRGEAFRRMAKRTGVEELQNLAAIIIQTDIFGTSVAKSLRVQADSMRIRRTQLAEERAATVSVKLTIPLVLCILPALFAVLMGPAAVKIVQILLPTLNGQ
jgi:tight adherence protein C